MALRTGNAYRESLRNGRQVWINSERVQDLPTHPAFKPIIDVRAYIHDMDMVHEARYHDVLPYDSGGSARSLS